MKLAVQTIHSINEATGNDKPKAIMGVLTREKFSDKELKNLKAMVIGEKPSDFKSANKILDKLKHDLKYSVDGFGLDDVKAALELMRVK